MKNLILLGAIACTSVAYGDSFGNGIAISLFGGSIFSTQSQRQQAACELLGHSCATAPSVKQNGREPKSSGTHGNRAPAVVPNDVFTSGR